MSLDPAPEKAPRSRVLVADDNAANRQVAVAMLAKIGVDADVVTNGEEAVAACRRRGYAAILMDCQMPVMDGYEATAAIRAQDGTPRTPIIAMTASAMAGEKEKCFAADMDDYLPKPIMLNDLQAIITRWIGRRENTTGSSASVAAGRVRASAFDPQRVEALRALDEPGGPDTFARFAALFVEQALGQIAALEQALSDGDVRGARHQAHALLGGAATIGAQRVAELCSSLEERLAAGTPVGLEAVVPITEELTRLMPAPAPPGGPPRNEQTDRR